MNENNAPALGENLMAALRLWQARVDAELNAQGFDFMAVSYTHLTLTTTPYV